MTTSVPPTTVVATAGRTSRLVHRGVLPGICGTAQACSCARLPSEWVVAFAGIRTRELKKHRWGRNSISSGSSGPHPGDQVRTGTPTLLGWGESEGKVISVRYVAVVTATLLLLMFGVTLTSAFQAPTGAGTSPVGVTGPGTSTTTSTTTSSTGAATTTTTKTHKKKATGHSVKGTVASVDTTVKSFVVHPAKGADVTVKVNDKTKYSPKAKTWDDVKADAKVTVSYHNDGTDNWALTVKFWPEAKAKAAKPAAATGKR
jgi:hypothetical protein